MSARGSKRSSKATKLSSSRRLGLGLVTVPEIPKADPLKTLMAEAKVPEGKRFCTGTKPDGAACEAPLTKEKCAQCGHTHEYTGKPRERCTKCGGKLEIVAREKGFCNVCGTPYDFKPKLRPGDLLAGQYEASGCIAFGGMGWIYLAKDVTLNRYVVLKGLLNSSDPNLAKAAVAERQFLAEVKHSNIVDVYTCVSDTRTAGDKTETHAYTVMEYVGGVTLKSLRKERGPLPAAEVLAYMHPVLLAFGYLHANGLLYNDFKPDNVMLEEGDIKLIDLGGVCRMTQGDGDIYSTVGYAAPELGSVGPSITSDLYSIGRAIAVLVTEFTGFQSSHRNKLRTPLEAPVYQQYDSLYRFLQKTCHDDPNMRFQHAEEMAEQLVGVLREIVASDNGTARPAESRIFGPDTLGVRTLDGADGVNALDIDSLPALKMNPEDPGAGFILGNLGSGDPRKQTPVLARALTQFPDSIEALLAMARNQLRLGNYEEAEKCLTRVEGLDPFDWRVIWYRGLALIAQKAPAEAVNAFETCYSEAPGELAVKLAIAIAAELSGDTARAIKYYECVSRTDPNYATALFGLGRCLAASGNRDDAVAALGRVAQTSNLYGEAQKAIAGTLLREKPNTPGPTELARASATIEALMLEGAERFSIAGAIFGTALRLLSAGQLKPAPDIKLLGYGLDDRGLRLGLEHAYRNLARLTDNEGEKIKLVDMANKARPKTFV
jgi:serine/threonine-protein kinase PknG